MFQSDYKNGYGIIFFGKNSKFNLSFVQEINSNKSAQHKVIPLVYKGNWAKDQLNGDGIIYLSNGLYMYG